MDITEKLAALIERHAQDDGTHATAIRGVTLIRASSPTLPMPVVYAPTLCVVAQGTKQATLGTTSYRYDPANFLVASVDIPVMGSVIEASASRPYLCLQLDLDTAELSELALRYPASPGEDGREPAALTLERTTPALLDAATRLLELLDAPQDIDALAPLVLREILYRLLTETGSGVVRRMAQADSHLNQISRAIIWIRRHFREPCRIADAADSAGMSRSTFHLHFKTITGMTPLAFRTRLRMQEAHRLMVSHAADAASAGFQVGYGSPSQFNRDYVRIFGTPPARHGRESRHPGQSEESAAPG